MKNFIEDPSELFDRVSLEEELGDLVDTVEISAAPPPQASYTPPSSKTKRPDQWIRTRQCWCGECRFFSLADRPTCPSATPYATGGWLWGTNPDYIRKVTDEELAMQEKGANVSANIMPISPEDYR